MNIKKYENRRAVWVAVATVSVIRPTASGSPGPKYIAERAAREADAVLAEYDKRWGDRK